MEAALDGVEGMYLSSPQSGFDAKKAAAIFIAAARKSNTLVYVIRQVVLLPEYDYNHMPAKLKEMMGGEYIEK